MAVIITLSRINRNREGLIHLAMLILDLANRDFEGAHFHLDNVIFDKCEMPLKSRMGLIN